MNGLPGNHHAEQSVRYACEASASACWTTEERLILAQQAATYATLALAYEQRTANMMASNVPQEVDASGWSEAMRQALVETAREISERMGRQ